MIKNKLLQPRPPANRRRRGTGAPMNRGVFGGWESRLCKRKPPVGAAVVQVIHGTYSPWTKSIRGLCPHENFQFSRELRFRHLVPEVRQAFSHSLLG